MSLRGLVPLNGGAPHHTRGWQPPRGTNQALVASPALETIVAFWGTYDLQWNQSRLVSGTKAYYGERRDTQVVDHMLLLLANSGQVPPFTELVRFCKDNKLLAASLATSDLSGLRQKAAEGKEQARKSHDRI